MTVDGAPARHSQLLPLALSSARSARTLVVEALRDLAPEARQDLVDVAVLLVSELTSNAILHARTPFTVAVTRVDDTLRVSVRDGSRALPARRHYSLSATTGRGMALVQACASRSGVEQDESGKTVWFELDLDAGTSDHDSGEVLVS